MDCTAIEAAAARAVRRLSAPDQALRRYATLAREGRLGQNMALAPRDRPQRSPKWQETPADAAAGIRPGASEPEIAAGIESNVGELWQAVDRVRLSRQALSRQGDPLGLAAPSSTRAVDAMVGIARGPTTERRAHIDTEITAYATTVRAGRDLASEAWRVTPIVEHMRRRGQLGEAEEQAATRFYRDFVLGHRVRGLVSSYGDRVSGGGMGEDGGELVQTRFHQAFIDACRAIGHMPTIEWMVRIVCEQIVAAETSTPTLRDAGRAYMGYKQDAQAQAAGATLLKTGLERLVQHYGMGEDSVRRRA